MSQKRLLKYTLDNNTEFFIEGIKESDTGISRTSKNGEDIIEVDKKFDEVISTVKPVSELIFKSFKDFNTPDDIELEFGLKFGAKAGIIFASADSEATFKLTLKWNNKKS